MREAEHGESNCERECECDPKSHVRPEAKRKRLRGYTACFAGCALIISIIRVMSCLDASHSMPFHLIRTDPKDWKMVAARQDCCCRVAARNTPSQRKHDNYSTTTPPTVEAATTNEQATCAKHEHEHEHEHGHEHDAPLSWRHRVASSLPRAPTPSLSELAAVRA